MKRRRILPSTYQLLVKNIIRAGFVLLDSGISVCQVRCGESSSCVWDGEARLSVLYNGPVVEDVGLSVSANNGDCISTGWLWEPDTWETEISHCPPAWATAPSPYRWTDRKRLRARDRNSEWSISVRSLLPIALLIAAPERPHPANPQSHKAPVYPRSAVTSGWTPFNIYPRLSQITAKQGKPLN